MDIVHHARYRSIKFNAFFKLNEVAEKVILTTAYIWNTTYSPVYMDNRAYEEIG
jgi:hypothetical protein